MHTRTRFFELKRCLLVLSALSILLFTSSSQVNANSFVRGDANTDGRNDISDGVFILGFLFLGTKEPSCHDAADADDSGRLDITDGIYLLNFLFLGTDAPPAPYPDCGEDATEDQLPCESFEACPQCSSEFPAPPVVNETNRVTAEQRITLSGTAGAGERIQVLGGQLEVEASANPDNGEFSLEVELKENRLNRLYVQALGECDVLSPPSVVDVVQDSQPPLVYIDEPEEAATITEETVTVVGRVSDQLSGFQGLSVQVNGQMANVAIGIGTNGTFELGDIPASIGTNTVEVTARDAVGNTVSPPLSVQFERAAPPPGASLLQKIAGDLQRAAIRSELPEPIVVEARSDSGDPLEGVLVRFLITRSDGLLRTSGETERTRVLEVSTDASGRAELTWQLGSDAGCGNNRLIAEGEGLFGSLTFCASAAPGPASQINVGLGNNQRAEVNAPAHEPLRAWVNDSCNGISGVPVTFSVTQGSGLVNGESEIVVRTGDTGHVEVNFVLGPEAGNQTVEARFEGLDGQPHPPAVFSVYAVERQEGEPTSFRGLVLDNASQPIEGAICVLQLASGQVLETTSSPQGQFQFEDIAEAGPVDLFIRGLEASAVGGQAIPPGSFPSLHFEPVLIPNAENSLSMPVLLPALDPRNVQEYSTSLETQLRVEGIDGLEMRIAPGSMRLADGRLAPDGTLVSLNQVHHDDVPMPMPDGASPPFAWTLQPAGATFDPPIEITYPNMSALPPGAVAYFLSFDHDTGKFEIVASGSVSEDGARIMTDPGAGLSLAGWGCNCPPYSVTGECSDSCCQTRALRKGPAGENDVCADALRELLENPFCSVQSERDGKGVL